MLKMIGITPHPPIIIPEIGRGRLHEVKKTVEAMNVLSSRLKDMEPELLIVISPHGQIKRGGPAVFVQEKLTGDFGQFGFSGIGVEMQTDQQLIDLLVEEASAVPVKPVLVSEHDRSIFSGKTLDHGAMVPLYYLQQAGLSLPGIHVSISFDSYRDLYTFGRALGKAVDRRGLPAAALASGDLSHRLTRDAPAGYSPQGKAFDQLLVELIGAGRVEDILNMDRHLVEEAGECGLRSFVIALGMLDGRGFKPEIFSYEGPFGVGYLVAALYPGGQDLSSTGEGGA